jgi:hypothetical protein
VGHDQSRIVLIAKRNVCAGEELTYVIKDCFFLIFAEGRLIVVFCKETNHVLSCVYFLGMITCLTLMRPMIAKFLAYARLLTVANT